MLLTVSVRSAEAVSVTIDSLTMLAGNQAYRFTNSNRSDSFDSAVNVVNGGGSVADSLGATVSAKTRYAYTQTADADGSFPGAVDFTATSNYRVVFTVDAGAGTVYDLQIDTARLGALVTRDESGSTATATINAVSGSLNGVGNANLGLAGPLSRSSSDTGVLAVNQGSTLQLLNLTGSNTYTLDFQWTTRTQSNNGILAGDEGVALFGLDTRVNTKVGAADDYPGTSGRTDPSADGHFVTVTATVVEVVPEPSTWIMAAVASLGAVFFRRRKSA